MAVIPWLTPQSFLTCRRQGLSGAAAETSSMWLMCCNTIPMGVGVGNQAIVELALSQLGQQGGQPYWSWYGFSGRVEWCACFVSWCANECGCIATGIIPKIALCSDGAGWFQAQGQWQGKNYEPAAGDIIFFDWDADGSVDHAGIVEYRENGVVHTAEGNSSDSCRQREYAIESNNIYGYALPAY